MKKVYLLLPLIGFMIIASCKQGEPEDIAEPKTEKQVNPNGDSELALLMRQMYEVGMEMKEHIENGKAPKADFPYKTILTATPTDEKFTDDPDFPTFAQSYITAMKNLQNADPEKVHLMYSGMVNTCMSCHRDMCPGPIVKIEKLYLEEEESVNQ